MCLERCCESIWTQHLNNLSNLMHKKKKHVCTYYYIQLTVLKVILSLNFDVIFWACALCVPAIIYTQWLGLPGGKKNIYMNLKGVIPVSCFCKAVTDNGNCLLWIFTIECYGNRCSWELYSNYSGVQCFLRNKQCNKSLKLGVKLDSRWRCHFLPYYMFHVIFFFTSE